MKIFNKVFYSLLIGSMFMSSCVSLEEDVTKVTITLDSYYQDEAQARGGLYGVYSSLRGYFKNHFIVMSTEGTLGVWGNRMQNYDYNPTHQYLLNNWRDGYRVIYNANIFLEKVKDIDMDEATKNQLMAEARFMRGLIYFNLTQFFGAVPLNLDAGLSYEDSLLPNGKDRDFEDKKLHIEKVYDQIVADLQFAEQHLPHASFSGEADALGETEVSRATVGAAKGLLAKVYLTMAGWPLNKGASHYQMAKDYAGEVIDLGYYRLIDDYAQIFTASNENNEEIIFNIEYVSLLDQGADWGGWHNDRAVDFDGGYGRIDMQASFYSQIETPEALNPDNAHYQAEDPRRAFVAVDWDPNKGLVYNNRAHIDYNKIGTWKFRHESIPLFRNQTDINCIVLRYADILLMYAEAEANLNGVTADALEKINMVRARARKGMPSITVPGNTPYNPADVTQCPIVIPEPKAIQPSAVPADLELGISLDELKETIVFDRVKELLMEGSDRFDLIRLGEDQFMHYMQFPKKTKSTPGKNRPTIVELDENCEEIKSAKLNIKNIDIKKVSDYTRKATPEKMWYPVPQIALDSNKNLTQNPGY